jgi:hypothetical protein
MEKYKICQSKHGTDSRAKALDSSVETLIIAVPVSKGIFYCMNTAMTVYLT